MRKRSCGERQWVICTGQRADDCGHRAGGGGADCADAVHPGVGVGGAAWRGAGNRRAGADLCGEEVTEMRVRMVCVKVPKPLRGVVRFLVKKRRKSS